MPSYDFRRRVPRICVGIGAVVGIVMVALWCWPDRKPASPVPALSLENQTKLNRSLELHAQAQAMFREFRFADAIPLTREALDLRLAVIGEDATSAAYFNDLGILHEEMGDLAQARQYMERSLQILSDCNIESSWQVASTNQSYAVTLARIGDYAAALIPMQKALSIQERLSGHTSRDSLTTRMNLQSIFLVLDAAESIELGQETVSLAEQVLGPKDRITIQSRATLADAYADLDRLAEAKTELEQCVEASRMDDGTLPPWSASMSSNLAELYRVCGQLDLAEMQFRAAQELLRAHNGRLEHNSLCTARRLGITLLQRGQLDEARRVLEEAWHDAFTIMSDVIPGLSEAEGLAFRRRTELDLIRDALLSLLDPESEADCRLAYEMSIRSKSVVLQAMLDRHSQALTNPLAEPILRELKDLRQKIAHHLISARASSDTELLPGLTLKKEQLERRLTEICGGNSLSQSSLVRPMTIPAGVVVLDFLFHRQLVRSDDDLSLRTEEVLDVFVLSSGATTTMGPIRWQRLGPAASIRDQIHAVFVHLSQPVLPDSSQAAFEAASQELGAQLWEPLRNDCEASETIVVVPDGVVSLVPWEALPDAGDSRFLIESKAFVRMFHISQINSRSEPIESHGNRLLLCGAIDYGPPDPRSDHSHETATRLEDRWNFLPATATEIAEIANIGRQTGTITVLQGAEATKSAILAAMPAAHFIHLATHGFVDRANQFKANEPDASVVPPDQKAPTMGFQLTYRGAFEERNPLAYCGLVFSGSNNPAIARNGGILSGEEIVAMNLADTQLMVLSACETARGEVIDREGVLGLQRAFQIAGAKTVVASLWQVDDYATQALMVEFYRNLWEKKLPRLESLRQAQLRMMTDYDSKSKLLAARGKGKTLNPTNEKFDEPLPPNARPSPYYWSGFVLSGEWR